MVIRHLLGAGVFCMAFSCATVFAAATASIDRTSINLAETFQLTLTLDEQSIFDKPDISILDNDFTVLGQQKSSQSSWINGEKSAKTQWIYQLAAKRSGVITIPPIDIDGEQTQPIVIKVNAGNKQPDSDGNLQPVFMEAEVNKQDLYVQEQLLLTLRINSSLNLHNLQLDELKLDNAFIVEVSNTNYQRMLNNTPYITYEVVYAIFPQTSGQLQIPAIAVNGLYANRSSFNSFFGGGSNIHVQSEPLSVEVKEIPAQLGNADWLPAHSLHLSETWSANPENIAVGDSITRTISISAEGLSGEQLPPLLMQADSHYKTYPDQPVFNDSKTSNGITGERKDAITLVATQPGEVSLPAITVQWWDINAKALKTETLPAVTIIIRGDATVASNTPAAAQPLVSTVESLPPAAIAAPAAAASAAVSTGGHAALPWQIATAISSMAALVFMLLFFTGKAKPASAGRQAPQPAATDEKILLNALEKACAASDVAAIRSQLLAWARHNWPDARIHATGDLHYLFESNEIRDWTRKIDANLYSAGHGKENWMELYRLAAQQQAALDSRKPALLKPLYPV